MRKVYRCLNLTYFLLLAPCDLCHDADDCLGSFCDKQYHPAICSPKTIKQVSVLSVQYRYTLSSAVVSMLCVAEMCAWWADATLDLS